MAVSVSTGWGEFGAADKGEDKADVRGEDKADVRGDDRADVRGDDRVTVGEGLSGGSPFDWQPTVKLTTRTKNVKMPVTNHPGFDLV